LSDYIPIMVAAFLILFNVIVLWAKQRQDKNAKQEPAEHTKTPSPRYDPPTSEQRDEEIAKKFEQIEEKSSVRSAPDDDEFAAFFDRLESRDKGK